MGGWEDGRMGGWEPTVRFMHLMRFLWGIPGPEGEVDRTPGVHLMRSP